MVSTFGQAHRCRVLARTPLIADLRPGGRFTACDVH